VADLRAAAAAFGVPDDRAVPVDLVTASASGLDPHVSQAAAEYQVARVAAVRGVAPADVRSVFATATVARRFGVLGEPVVHVLRANLALDAAFGRLQR
jgi:K+-transporting ATPase ATPase C chain